MSNSPLAKFRYPSPNKNTPRNHKIDTITIHCMAGNCTVKTVGGIFANKARRGSSNYGVDSFGDVAVYVDEADRSWCTSDYNNDHRAVTIEVANDGGSETGWHVNDIAYEKLIMLVADICKRNDIATLKWSNNPTLIGDISKQNMTIHRWFKATDCPGQFLYSHMGDIAKQVNDILNPKTTTVEAKANNTPVTDYTDAKNYPALPFTVEVLVKDLNYRDKPSMNGKVRGQTGKGVFTIVNFDSGWGKLKSDSGWIWLGNTDFTEIQNGAIPQIKEKDFKEFLVRVATPYLNIRSGSGSNYKSVGQTGVGVFTIVDVKTGVGSANGWGKLKSGEGWISLDYTRAIS